MLKKMFLAASMIMCSVGSQAAVISHYGYQRDSATNIIKGNGLEWLAWNVTNGLSIHSALTTYSKDGWRLASGSEMAALYNAFQFGKSDWSASEADLQENILPWIADKASPMRRFVSMFGHTYQYTDRLCPTPDAYNCYSADDYEAVSYALFGSDDSGRGSYRLASVSSDYTWLNTGFEPWRYGGHARLTQPNWSASWPAGSGTGVALVRTAQGVSAPTSLALVVFGLLILGMRRRSV